MEEKLLEEWQERLGLQDWLICLRYNCKPEDMELQDVDGEITVKSEIKEAIIRILDPKLCEGITEFDFEEILVHELVHCKFDVIDFKLQSYEGTVTDLVRHSLIDDLARALVLAKRGQTKRKLTVKCQKVKNMTNED